MSTAHRDRSILDRPVQRLQIVAHDLGAMAPFEKQLSAEEIKGLVVYVRQLGRK